MLSAAGPAVSPVPVNLFMHYAFDVREYPMVEFECYADEAVVHCATGRHARQVLAQVRAAAASVKTKIVYCGDGRRRGTYPHTSRSPYLGFTFRSRRGRESVTARVFLSLSPRSVSRRVGA